MYLLLFIDQGSEKENKKYCQYHIWLQNLPAERFLIFIHGYQIKL